MAVTVFMSVALENQKAEIRNTLGNAQRQLEEIQTQLSTVVADKDKHSPAYYSGREKGEYYGKLDRNFDSLEHIKLEPDKALFVLSQAKIKFGSNEAGDFWDGYSEGYMSARH